MSYSVRPLPHTPGTYGVPPRQYRTRLGKDDPHFNLEMKFGDELCGRLIYEDNLLKFTGSFQTSGRIFAEFIWHKFKEWYVDDTENSSAPLFYPVYRDPEAFEFPRGKPAFNLTFDLDGMTIGKFWYEDMRLQFNGNVDESAQIWVDWVIEKFQEWHDESCR